jgi:hypothetical protein
MHNSRLVAVLYNATFSVVSWGGAGEVLAVWHSSLCAVCWERPQWHQAWNPSIHIEPTPLCWWHFPTASAGGERR